MKVNLLDRRSMHFCLGRAQTPKDAQCHFRFAVRQLTSSYYRFDVA